MADDDPVFPEVRAFPQCSECQIAYVLRRAYRINTGDFGWVWQRDCKHKYAQPKLVAAS